MDRRLIPGNVESAGAKFLGEYSAFVFKNFSKLNNDPEFKDEFTQEVFNNFNGEENIKDIRRRINATMRIMRSGRITETLEYIISSEEFNREEPATVELAKKALKEIKQR